MTPVPRVQSIMRRALVMTILAAAAAAPAAAQPQQKPPVAKGQVNAHAAALAEFQARLDQYLELRQSLAGKLEPLAVTTESAQLVAHQSALGAAMRTARQGAKQGDLVPAAVADVIRKVVAQDLARRRAAVDKAVLREVPDVKPVINKVYPAPEELTTMPPLVLANLPRLPDNLQYRYLGRSVVLFDGDLHIIADYVPNALPPH